MKPVKTWIVVADAGSARIIENRGPGKGLHQLGNKTRKVMQQPAPKDHEGRTFNSANPTRHKLEGHKSVDKSLCQFAHDLAEDLSVSHRKNQFDRLIVCAAPEILAQLRKQLPGPVKSDVIAEIPKDLTHIPTDALPEHFNDVLAI